MGASASPLPQLDPPDRSLLSRFLALKENLDALSAESGRDLIDLLLWLTRPDIDQYVQAFRDTRNNSLRQLALSHLESILKTAEDPIEKRRAATVILRALTVSPRRGECRPDSFGKTRGAPGRPSGRPTSNSFHRSTTPTAPNPRAATVAPDHAPLSMHNAPSALPGILPTVPNLEACPPWQDSSPLDDTEEDLDAAGLSDADLDAIISAVRAVAVNTLAAPAGSRVAAPPLASDDHAAPRPLATHDAQIAPLPDTG